MRLHPLLHWIICIQNTEDYESRKKRVGDMGVRHSRTIIFNTNNNHYISYNRVHP